MKLLCVCAVGHAGGAEIGLVRLLERLDPDRWSIAATTPEPGPLTDELAARGWGGGLLPLGPLVGGSVGSLRAIGSWPALRGRARDVDIVYLNGGTTGRLLPALAGARARRVLHVHDMVERVPRFWSMADLVLADSAAVAGRLPRLAAEVVYCPVEPDPPLVDPPWPPGEGPIIGFVGRLEPRKGPLDLLAAAPAIRALIPHARVVLIGDDPYSSDPHYRDRVRMGEAEHYGWMEEAAGVMRHLDVLVCPSRQEPFGTVVAEAMTVGTPVVATRVGGLPEVVQDGVSGVLIDPGAPDQIAPAVARVLADRPAMSLAARERAKRFHADAYAQRVSALLTAGLAAP